MSGSAVLKNRLHGVDGKECRTRSVDCSEYGDTVGIVQQTLFDEIAQGFKRIAMLLRIILIVISRSD